MATVLCQSWDWKQQKLSLCWVFTAAAALQDSAYFLKLMRQAGKDKYCAFFLASRRIDALCRQCYVILNLNGFDGKPQYYDQH